MEGSPPLMRQSAEADDPCEEEEDDGKEEVGGKEVAGRVIL